MAKTRFWRRRLARLGLVVEENRHVVRVIGISLLALGIGFVVLMGFGLFGEGEWTLMAAPCCCVLLTPWWVFSGMLIYLTSDAW